MERDVVERRLALVERQITQGEQHAAIRRSNLAGLEAAGRGASETADIIRDLLYWNERNLQTRIAERKWLWAQLRRTAVWKEGQG
jgi:hypothetical protein